MIVYKQMSYRTWRWHLEYLIFFCHALRKNNECSFKDGLRMRCNIYSCCSARSCSFQSMCGEGRWRAMLSFNQHPPVPGGRHQWANKLLLSTFAEDSSALTFDNLQWGEVSTASSLHRLKRPARGDHILSWLFPLCFPVSASCISHLLLRFRPGVCHTECTPSLSPTFLGFLCLWVL